MYQLWSPIADPTITERLQVQYQIMVNFLSGDFMPLSLMHVRKVVSDLGKENCVSTGVRNPVSVFTNHFKNFLCLVLQIFLNLEAFECNTTSDWLNHTV